MNAFRSKISLIRIFLGAVPKFGIQLAHFQIPNLMSAEVFVGFTPKSTWELFNASSCFIIDNKRLADLFSPIEAPRDFGLVDLYSTMGSSTLSGAVKISYKPQGEQKTTLHSKALQVFFSFPSPSPSPLQHLICNFSKLFAYVLRFC